MSDIQVARVEAAVKAIEKIPHIVWNSPTRYDAMVLAEAAIAAADAAVTVEMIAKALFDVRDDEFDLDEWEDIDGSERERYICDARAVLAILRGGEERE